MLHDNQGGEAPCEKEKKTNGKYTNIFTVMCWN